MNGGVNLSEFRKFAIRNYQELLSIVLISMTIVCVLLDIVQIFSITAFYRPYIVFIPILFIILLRLFCVEEKNINIQKNVYYALGLSIVEYLVLVMLDKMVLPLKGKIAIYLITGIYMLVYNKLKEVESYSIKKESNNQQNEKKIFSLYYINTEKVYEIAMLLNNKIITGGTNENELDSSMDKQTNIGINSNLSYLEFVKGNISLSENTQMHNSVKSKVLENFDVKTTKSNLLASIITQAKEYKEESVEVGDLILMKNVSLKLLNAEESYAVTRMILNGAFKDTKISSNLDDMKIEFDLSAMINSLLKDCAYELGCEVDNKNYLLTIPMTFENDFENSYNIYDLQVGSVSVVGIYKGQRQYEKRLSLQEIFDGNNEQKKAKSYEDSNFKLKSSNEKGINDGINYKNNQFEKYKEVIDVIAIIQEINPKYEKEEK